MLVFKSCKWLITINRSLLGNRYTHNEIKKILSGLHLDYWCMSDEWCKQNYYTVVFIYSSIPIRQHIISSFFPDVSFLPVRGCCKLNRMFVWKEGIWKKKFPRVISLHRTREQWHRKGINLRHVLYDM